MSDLGRLAYGQLDANEYEAAEATYWAALETESTGACFSNWRVARDGIVLRFLKHLRELHPADPLCAMNLAAKFLEMRHFPQSVELATAALNLTT